MENNNDGVDISNTTEEKLDPDLTTDTEPNSEKVEDLKARLTKAEELAKNQKIRAEKAEKLAKEKLEEKPKETPKDTLSDSDMFALLKNNIHEDDVERVKKFAKADEITVAEALKSDELKAILDLRSEQRATAGATNVGATRRTQVKVSGDELINQAKSGKFPESDSDIARLMEAKLYEGVDKK